MIQSAFTVEAAFEWAEQYFVPVILPVLLGMDIAMLKMDRRMMKLALKEQLEREDHITKIKENTETLSRRDYELTIGRATLNAEKRIYCYWHSLHPEEASGPYEVINDGLAKAKSEDVEVKLVIAKDPSRIAAAYELVDRGIDVVFQDSLLVSDLRFSLFDQKMTVFGMPKSAFDDGKPSRHGVDIHNYKLNALLAKYFECEFASASKFDAFVASIACEGLRKNSKEMVARELGIPVSVVERCCPDPPEPDDGSGCQDQPETGDEN